MSRWKELKSSWSRILRIAKEEWMLHWWYTPMLTAFVAWSLLGAIPAALLGKGWRKRRPWLSAWLNLFAGTAAAYLVIVVIVWLA